MGHTYMEKNLSVYLKFNIYNYSIFNLSRKYILTVMGHNYPKMVFMVYLKYKSEHPVSYLATWLGPSFRDAHSERRVTVQLQVMMLFNSFVHAQYL